LRNQLINHGVGPVSGSNLKLSTIIRKVVGDRSENYATISSEWILQPQVEALERWLQQHHGELDPCFEWIADIGFTHRPNACGGGPVMSRGLMRMCLDANMEVFLSEYGPSGDDKG
jgi:hypothetical protein